MFWTAPDQTAAEAFSPPRSSQTTSRVGYSSSRVDSETDSSLVKTNRQEVLLFVPHSSQCTPRRVDMDLALPILLEHGNTHCHAYTFGNITEHHLILGPI